MFILGLFWKCFLGISVVFATSFDCKGILSEQDWQRTIKNNLKNVRVIVGAYGPSGDSILALAHPNPNEVVGNQIRLNHRMGSDGVAELIRLKFNPKNMTYALDKMQLVDMADAKTLALVGPGGPLDAINGDGHVMGRVHSQKFYSQLFGQTVREITFSSGVSHDLNRAVLEDGSLFFTERSGSDLVITLNRLGTRIRSYPLETSANIFQQAEKIVRNRLQTDWAIDTYDPSRLHIVENSLSDMHLAFDDSILIFFQGVHFLYRSSVGENIGFAVVRYRAIGLDDGRELELPSLNRVDFTKTIESMRVSPDGMTIKVDQSLYRGANSQDVRLSSFYSTANRSAVPITSSSAHLFDLYSPDGTRLAEWSDTQDSVGVLVQNAFDVQRRDAALLNVDGDRFGFHRPLAFSSDRRLLLTVARRMDIRSRHTPDLRFFVWDLDSNVNIAEFYSEVAAKLGSSSLVSGVIAKDGASTYSLIILSTERSGNNPSNIQYFRLELK